MDLRLPQFDAHFPLWLGDFRMSIIFYSSTFWQVVILLQYLLFTGEGKSKSEREAGAVHQGGFSFTCRCVGHSHHEDC